ncbi:hypothetical protein MG296_14370 [Flavobacteriaceae bacterium TK19130]|nr:hypothetical protein [Thermobacterium salinum]
MKKLLLGILLVSSSVYSQEFNFDIHNTSLLDYIKMEEELGSERLDLNSNHVSYSGDAQPIKYLRKEPNIPDLMAYYFFKRKDSTMSYILYEWDVYNFEKEQNNQKSYKFQKSLVDKYQSLKKTISGEFGVPESKTQKSNLSREKSESRFEETSNWRVNDSTEIELYVIASNFYQKRGMVTTNPTHRIRLYIRNKDKEQQGPSLKIGEEKLKKFEKIKNDFFNELQSEDYAKAKTYLSDLIIENVTDEQLESLVENIDFNRDIEIIYSGVQMGLDGSAFSLLQYKYVDDSSDPPSEMIKLVFDDKDKIVGIQPMKMQKND